MAPAAEYESPSFESAAVSADAETHASERETMTAPRGISREDAEAMALALPRIQSQLGGGSPRKVIVVPDRLVNIVA